MSISPSLLNLVATLNMSAYKLRKVEVAYELKIRGLSTDGSANDLRKRLTQAMSKNTPINEASVNSLQFDEELEECTLILDDLEDLVQQYEGNFKDDEYQRIVARLWHLYPRVERIPIPDAEDTQEEESQEKRMELQRKVKSLLDSFVTPEVEKPKIDEGPARTTATQETLPIKEASVAGHSKKPSLGPSTLPLAKPVDTTNRHNGTPSELVLANQDRPQLIQQSQSLAANTKTVPVYKWGLRFDGQGGQSVGAFLERVEEIRRARGVTHEELFKSAVDLFAGQALVWYRSTISRVKSWNELCQEMRIVFRTPDYDFRLQQEIFNRLQGEQESIDMFIAAMEGLYSRLSINTPESVRLAQILNNLHPTLQDRLALCDIKTLEDLRLMGRKAEAGRFRVTVPRNVDRTMGVLEPDLAYAEPHKRRTPQISCIRQVAPTKGSVKCWNCGARGHRYATCKEAKKKFCYGCGEPDTIKNKCQKCGPKNL